MSMKFFYGWLIFKLTGNTPGSAFVALIWLFRRTGGRFNEFVSSIISIGQRQRVATPVQGVLGVLDRPVLDEKMAELREKGYLIFPSALSTELCDRLMAFAMRTPCIPIPKDGEEGAYWKFDARQNTYVPAPTGDGRRSPVIFDPLAPKAVRYSYKAQDLLDCADVQGLLADKSLLAICAEYLNAVPIVDIVTMWWNTSVSSTADANAAQLFHSDMDRVKWLKVFFYLTDVAPEDGPHVFISGSHKVNGIPFHLNGGSYRQKDEDVLRHYGKDREITFPGPRGTIIIEDTHGLHKGAVVQPEGKARLVLQFELCNSLLGKPLDNSDKLRHIVNSSLQEAIALQRKTYSLYL